MTINYFYLIFGLVFLTGSARSSVQSIRAMYSALPRSLPLTNPTPPPITSTTTLPTTTTPASTTPVLEKMIPPSSNIQAQERESQNFDSYVPEIPGSAPQNFNPGYTPQQSFQQTSFQQQQQQQDLEKRYSSYVYAQPLPYPGNHIQQQIGTRMYSPYTGQVGQFDTEGQRPVHDVSSSSWYSNFRAKDALVGLAVLGLVGSGGALWYHQLVRKAKSSRALMEMVEQFGNNEDTARMARSVLMAIRRYSAVNNEDFKE